MILLQYILSDNFTYDPIQNFQCQSSEDCNNQICLQQNRTCKCDTLHYGQQCNMTAEQCRQAVCNNNGNCIQSSTTCNCDEGFILLYCNFTESDCGIQICNGNGACVYSQQSEYASCNCTQEFQGQYCEQCSQNYTQIGNQCVPSSCVYQDQLYVCNNGGECIYIENQNQSYQCECNISYQGQYCEQCANGFTEYNGRCTTDACITGDTVCYDRGYCNAIQCVCDDDYYGNQCEYTCSCINGNCIQGVCRCGENMAVIEISEEESMCVDIACIDTNGSICSGYQELCYDSQCNCQSDGYNLNGQYCEYNCSDYCVYGTCYLNENQTVLCDCPQYMFGDRCEFYNCPQNMTALNGTCVYQGCLTADLQICNNHGTCLESNQSCQCEQGWYTDLCIQSQYSCNQERCQGRGVCNVNGTCSCYNGIVAENCMNCNSTETLVNGECIDQNCFSDISNLIVCNNQGTCQSGICVCNENYTNVQCQETYEQCKQNNCFDAGECSVVDNALRCTCYYLNYGDQCDQCEVSEEVIMIQGKYCSPISCQYQETVCNFQGLCEQDTCQCNQTYFGAYCEIPAENCSQLLCSGHGECYNVVSINQTNQTNNIDLQSRNQLKPLYVSYTQQIACNCTQHYTQSDCSICPEGHTLFLDQCVQNGWFDPNDTIICNGHGYIGYNATCECDQGYIGRTCNLTEQSCDNDLCGTRGICDNLGHYCSCNAQNFAGDFCQKCNSGYIGSSCISSTPIIIAVVIVLVIIIIIITIFAVISWKKRAKMGQMKQIKKIGFGFNKRQDKIVEPNEVEMKV